jgi:Peptidase inhibitor I78 family
MKSLLPFVVLALCGCANTAREAPDTTEILPAEKAGGFACAAESVQYAIGQKTSAELGSKMVAESGSATLRWLPPHSMATMDYRPDRLNVHYNDDMIITRVNCG